MPFRFGMKPTHLELNGERDAEACAVHEEQREPLPTISGGYTLLPLTQPVHPAIIFHFGQKCKDRLMNRVGISTVLQFPRKLVSAFTF